jgi:hypothetical protein
MQVKPQAPGARKRFWRIEQGIFTAKVIPAGGEIETANETRRCFAAVAAERAVNFKQMTAIVLRTAVYDGAAQSKNGVRRRAFPRKRRMRGCLV